VLAPAAVPPLSLVTEFSKRFYWCIGVESLYTSSPASAAATNPSSNPLAECVTSSARLRSKVKFQGVVTTPLHSRSRNYRLRNRTRTRPSRADHPPTAEGGLEFIMSRSLASECVTLGSRALIATRFTSCRRFCWCHGFDRKAIGFIAIIK